MMIMNAKDRIGCVVVHLKRQQREISVAVQTTAALLRTSFAVKFENFSPIFARQSSRRDELRFNRARIKFIKSNVTFIHISTRRTLTTTSLRGIFFDRPTLENIYRHFTHLHNPKEANETARGDVSGAYLHI